MTPTSIARVCHEANRALQIEQADTSIPVSPHWDELDEETRTSIVQGVEGVLAGKTPEESHQAWVEFKLAHGWSLGSKKDIDAKRHPLLIPYASLPEHQRLKDDLFAAIVRTLAGTS